MFICYFVNFSNILLCSDSEGTVSNSDSPVPDDPVDALSTGSDLAPGPDVDVESQSGLPVASPAEHDIGVVALVAIPSASEEGKVNAGKRPVLVVGTSKRALSVLPRVPEHTLIFGRDEVSLVTPFMLDEHLRGNKAVAE